MGVHANLWRDRESGTETVHRLVILSTEVEENSQTTLQLGVHLGRVRVGCTQEQGLDVRKQRSVQEKQGKKGQIEGDSEERETLLQVFCNHWICIFCFKSETVLTLAGVTRTSPSPSPYLWHHLFGVRAHSAPKQSGILDCASANHEESHRPACAVTH